MISKSKYYLTYNLTFLVIGLIVSCLISCNLNSEPVSSSLDPMQSQEPLFELLLPEQTGVYFTNNIQEDAYNSIIDYDYMYNGGGVAIGDINNDGLKDIYFTGNMVPNKLYLNKGNLKFEDITEKANVGGQNGWSSGVTMVDINNDGYLDIYVCRSYYKNDPDRRRNLLYINNQDGTFTEQAAKYGIDDPAYSVQAAFFDYDRDGDLDFYLANHVEDFQVTNEQRIEARMDPHDNIRDKLYKNNGDGSFTEVSIAAGINNYGCGLGVAIGDLNNDSWPDIYVANDYADPDFYYVNNGDGTFTESLKDAFKHTSFYGMGTDLADFNNDGLLDLVELDMVAEDNFRQKTNMSAMNPEGFWFMVANDFHYQYMRNSFQINNGNGSFSEIGQLAGMSNTDWSWATLLADFDNDGDKDLIITNGFRRDSQDKDAKNNYKRLVQEQDGTIYREQIDTILGLFPSVKLKNYYYRNNGDLTFTDMTDANNFDQPSFSNGASYGDLDNDGDLDIVVNNLLDPAFIYENKCNTILKNRFLRITLVSEDPNNSGLGAKVTIRTADGNLQFIEKSVSRGYQSSIENNIHFGLGKEEMIDELTIVWPNGHREMIRDIQSNQVLVLYQNNAQEPVDQNSPNVDLLFSELESNAGVDFVHIENVFDDFENEILLPHKMSRFGPHVSIGDVNNDGLDDFYIGGAAGQPGAMFLQNKNSKFSRVIGGPWELNSSSEDIGSVLFDSDNDGDLDLYVVSGGNEFETTSLELQDRLYLNDGSGNFAASNNKIPEMLTSGSCVVPGDYDNDGDQDLFVGGRVIPGKYPFAPRSYILNNEAGVFTDVTKSVAPDLFEVGLVTSAIWTDYDNDGNMDLIVVGEWMPVSLFHNNNGKFERNNISKDMDHSTGWWNKIVQADFDKDGDMDYVVGNLGLNYKYKAESAEPLHVYCYDFDRNGSLDIVLGYYNSGICYPVRGRQCSSQQMPFILQKFPNYTSFGGATLEDVYGDGLDRALHYEANNFATSMIENKGNGKFVMHELPIEAQFSTAYGIVIEDFNNDGDLDILLAGNFYVSEVETGRADAGIGLLMEGNGNNGFTPVPVYKSGFYAPHDVRDLALLNTDKGAILIIANNNDKPQLYRVKSLVNQPAGEALAIK